MTLPTRLRTLPVALPLVGLFALGAVAGYLAYPLLQGSRNCPSTQRVREQSLFRFINPLLDCEGAAGNYQQPEMQTLGDDVVARIEEYHSQGKVASWGIYFRRLNDGPWFGINERETFSPASLMKIPILMAALKKAESDPAFLSREILNDATVDLNRLEHFTPPETLAPGQRYRVQELLERMVRNSDNNALALLQSVVTAADYARVLRDLGLPDPRAEEAPISVKDYTAFLRVLYNATYLSKEMSERALEILTQSSFQRGIVAGLPPGTMVASKYGEALVGQEGSPRVPQLHEFAIVYHPRTPYLLGIMTRGPEFEALADLIREVSSIVYRDVDRQRP